MTRADSGYRRATMPDAQSFAVAVAETEPVVLLRARGDVDASSVDALNGALDGAIRDLEGHVVLDADAVTFIDSTGITALMTAMRRLHRGRRRLAVACGEGCALEQALRMTGLDHTFDVHPTAEAAVAVMADAPQLGR
jgi:anti-anti-sigma factor